MPNKILKKIVSRDLAVFTLQLWTLGYLQIEEVFGSGYGVVVGKREHGTFLSYRNEEEHNKVVEAFQKKFLEKPEEFILLLQKTEKSVKKIKEIAKNKLTKENISEIKKLYIQAWPCVIANYYLPEIISKRKTALSKEQRQVLEYNDKFREETEGFYDQVEKDICEYIQKKSDGLSKDLIINTTLEELYSSNFASNEDLENRDDMVVINGKAYNFKEGDNVLQALGYEYEKIEIDNSIKTIKGQIAHKGKVQGIAKVVFTKREIEKVKEGDVLISPMTTPDFLPAMKKAIAFVTDEGALLCHVAIVAREMKKACVIGTKIATQVLKDGDLVEVDAEKGIINILK